MHSYVRYLEEISTNGILAIVGSALAACVLIGFAVFSWFQCRRKVPMHEEDLSSDSKEEDAVFHEIRNVENEQTRPTEIQRRATIENRQQFILQSKVSTTSESFFLDPGCTLQLENQSHFDSYIGDGVWMSAIESNYSIGSNRTWASGAQDDNQSISSIDLSSMDRRNQDIYDSFHLDIKRQHISEEALEDGTY